jgi:nitrite reductase/ring-hydroxylating ferredoxin subunit
MPQFSANWAQELLDSKAFREEQRRLAGVWTFLGLSRDLGRDGDWFCSSIATVFVQRFGTELRGFENLCAHRSYPLRRERKGSGPVVCGFHHWQYNRDGRAVGIPICNLAYGKPPHEMDAHLQPIELAMCGPLIFGRFPGRSSSESLESYLGDAFPILEAMAPVRGRPLYMELPVQAHWKLNMHITLDDYHGPPIHPRTLERHAYLPSMNTLRYFRLGTNSAYLFSDDERCFDKLLEGFREGTYRSSHFFIFQNMPNLAIAHVDADRPFLPLLPKFGPRRAAGLPLEAAFRPSPVLPAAAPLRPAVRHRQALLVHRFSPVTCVLDDHPPPHPDVGPRWSSAVQPGAVAAVRATPAP